MTFLALVMLFLLNRAPHPAATVMRVMVAPAETLAVTATGTGSPIVIIPGLLGGAFAFRKVTAELDSTHERVLIVDPLGTGGSSHPRDANYSMQSQAERVASVLDSLGIKHAALVGHGAGVPIALRLALLRPELVSSMVSVNGNATEKFGSGPLRIALKLGPLLKLLGKTRATNHVIAELHQESADSAWITNDVVAVYTAPYKTDFGAMMRVLKSLSNSHEPWPLLPRLKDLHMPVLMLVGTGATKPGVKAEDLAAMRVALPAMRVDSLAGVGLWVQEERPDLLVRAIRSMRTN